MADTKERPALTMEEGAERVAKVVAEQEERLKVAREDLAQFESSMGRFALQGDSSQLALTLAARIKERPMPPARAVLAALKLGIEKST